MLIPTPVLRALPGNPGSNCTAGTASSTGFDEPPSAPGSAANLKEWPSTPTDAPMALATPAETRGAVDSAETVRTTAAFRLDPIPESAGRARRCARAKLADWRLGHLAEDVDLVVSELVTNALLHTGEGHEAAAAPIRLELDLTARRLTCRVVDTSPTPPVPEEAADTAESGRGLILVEALAAEWDWETLPEGKAVWAAFDL
jgi:anti-sigma regulatory factor (Ser/Thr protein kinase)